MLNSHLAHLTPPLSQARRRPPPLSLLNKLSRPLRLLMLPLETQRTSLPLMPTWPLSEMLETSKLSVMSHTTHIQQDKTGPETQTAELLYLSTLTDPTQLTSTRPTEPTPTETTDQSKSQLPQEAKSNKDGNLLETPTTGLKTPKPDNRDGPTRSTHGPKSWTTDLEMTCKNLNLPILH